MCIWQVGGGTTQGVEAGVLCSSLDMHASHPRSPTHPGVTHLVALLICGTQLVLDSSVVWLLGGVHMGAGLCSIILGAGQVDGGVGHLTITLGHSPVGLSEVGDGVG